MRSTQLRRFQGSINNVRHLCLSYNNITNVSSFANKLDCMSKLYLNGNNIETVISLKNSISNLYCLNIQDNSKNIKDEVMEFNIPLIYV